MLLKRPGLVDRVQVDGLSGHSYKGSVPLWHKAVPLPEDAGVVPCVSSGVKEPRPDVEAVFADWTLCRSSSSSAFCFLTNSSSLPRQKNNNNETAIKLPNPHFANSKLL